MKTSPHHFLVAIVGGSGAGKTWLVQQLCRVLGENASRLELDDFYRDRSHLPLARRARINFDLPDAIDWADAVRVLRDCRQGLPTRVPRYDFATHTRGSESRSWIPSRVVFVDGLWLLRTAELRSMFDLSIFVDTPPPLRLQRRLARDTAERGYTAEAVRRRVLENVMPMHERYVEPQKRVADIVLTQPYRETEVEELTDRLWNLLSQAPLLPPWMRETFRAEVLSLLVQHEFCH